MTDEEKALRLTMLTEMFEGYGVDYERRLRWYANMTHRIPLENLRQAIRNACAEGSSDFAPSPARIISAARWLHESYGGDEIPSPPWYKRMKRELKDADHNRLASGGIAALLAEVSSF